MQAVGATPDKFNPIPVHSGLTVDIACPRIPQAYGLPLFVEQGYVLVNRRFCQVMAEGGGEHRIRPDIL